MIKLIVTDMDGTLLMDHERIHPRNLEAIKRAMAEGIGFAVASGREAASCSRVLLAHGITRAQIIAVNGCQTLDGPNGNILSTYTIPPDIARETLRIYAAHGLSACLFSIDEVLYPTREDAIAISNKPEAKHGTEAIEKALSGEVFKTFCIALPGQEAILAQAREECAAISGVSITSSWHNNFEVMPGGVNKGKALSALAQRLGTSLDSIIAFGDNENDLEMLKVAGYGYAMGNAPEHVRAQASRVTGLNKEGGVAQGICEVLGWEDFI